MIYGKIALAGWRVACVHGEQPESSFKSNNLRVFFYGTLYNRDTLQAHPDESNAKLAAAAYLSDPSFGFSRLDGSFTIVYYSENECGVVRDRHGTHYPIYAMKNGNFATSWQLLEEQSKEKFSYDSYALSTFLQRGLLKEKSSSIADVLSLQAGERFRFVSEEGNMSHLKSILSSKMYRDLERFRDSNPEMKKMMKECGTQIDRSNTYNYEAKAVIHKNADPESYSHRYGELHAQAIRRRIGDSRRVGILLSGGYDSGSNLAALRSIYDGDIDSYSVGFKGDTLSELPMARLMSETFGTRHHEYEIDGSEINALPDIIRFLGEPFVEGGLMVNYCAMRMIGDDKPEVILGGDGSDQYFGTSGREVALHYLAARTGMRPLLRGVNNWLDRESFDTGGKLSRIHFHLDKMLHLLEGERFGFSDSALCKLLQRPKEDFEPTPFPKLDTRCFEILYMQHAIHADLKIVIDRIILFKASRMAQMFDNNLTFPFMDLELFKFLQELPVSLKCKGDSVLDIARGHGVSKYLLKYHYKPLLPEAITSKKKQGGFAPMPLFFRNPAQRARFKEFILSSGVMNDFLCKEAVEKFLTDYDREASQEGGWFWHKQNKALQYFNLLTLAVWWEQFVEEKEVKF